MVFLACFSDESRAKGRSYMNEELTLAVEEFRLRPPGRTWLIPVRFDAGEVPEWDLGAGLTLGDLNYVDLFGDEYTENAVQLATAINAAIGTPSPEPATVRTAVEEAEAEDGPALLRRDRYQDQPTARRRDVEHAKPRARRDGDYLVIENKSETVTAEQFHFTVEFVWPGFADRVEDPVSVSYDERRPFNLLAGGEMRWGMEVDMLGPAHLTVHMRWMEGTEPREASQTIEVSN
jgi:hypothetical protein